MRSRANEKRLAQEREYDRVRLEVTRFKSDVLNLYRSHVESLSRLPEYKKEDAAEEPSADAAPDAAASAETETKAAPESSAAEQSAEVPAAAAVEEQIDAAADAENSAAADSSEDFWEKDESQLKLDPPADAKPDSDEDEDAFQGVQFSE